MFRSVTGHSWVRGGQGIKFSVAFLTDGVWLGCGFNVLGERFSVVVASPTNVLTSLIRDPDSSDLVGSYGYHFAPNLLDFVNCSGWVTN